MALYIYCPRRSTGALELVHALSATRLRRFDGMSFWDKKRKVPLKSGDVLVAWGAHIPELDGGVRVLNSSDRMGKYQELQKISGSIGHTCTTLTTEQFRSLNPAKRALYLGRLSSHIGGNDLLAPPRAPDFYVQKDTFTKEYRIHSFGGKSIRAGEKVVRDGFRLCTDVNEWRPNAGLAHPWIRSFDGGWRVRYDAFQSTSAMRQLAHAAVNALSLTFGAVDMGLRADGTLIIFEVNRAPGIEGASIASYARAITRWIEGKADAPKAKGLSV